MTAPRLGVLGAGQLGRMLALAARPMEIGTRLYDVDGDVPGASVGEVVAGAFDDAERLTEFADGLDVVTYEFENIPVEAVEIVAKRTEIHPNTRALQMAQDRLSEKSFFESIGIPVAPHHAVTTRADLDHAVEELGFPAVLKTRRMGYDGKGQFVIRGQGDVEAAWEEVGGVPLILETLLELEREISVIGVRGHNAEIRIYPLTENTHENGVLRLSIAPARPLPEGLAEMAREWMVTALRDLDYVGVLAIELFVSGGRLYVNEMAPRVHNSGHWTIEGAVTSQFENHVRAVLDLPLGDTSAFGHSCMVNLLGAQPPLEQLLAVPGSHVHLYGKAPRPGRKLGHVTVTAGSATELAQSAETLLQLARGAAAPAQTARP